MHAGLAQELDRRAPRQRTFLGGKLLYAGAYSTDCIVRDMSDKGARLELPNGLPIPDEVQLLELKSGIAFDARVIWRRYPQIGIKFTNQHLLGGDVSPSLRILKRLWLNTRQLQ